MMARAAIAPEETERVGVHELRLAARDGRSFGVGQPRVDRERGALGFAAELYRLFDADGPRVVKVEVGPAPGEAVGIRETRRRILGGIARDRERLVHGRSDGGVGEIRRARVPATLSHEHGHADALVPVVGDGLHLALAHGHALPDALRNLGLGGAGPALGRGLQNSAGHTLELSGGDRKMARVRP